MVARFGADGQPTSERAVRAPWQAFVAAREPISRSSKLRADLDGSQRLPPRPHPLAAIPPHSSRPNTLHTWRFNLASTLQMIAKRPAPLERHSYFPYRESR